MENQRTFLIIAFLAISGLLYIKWVEFSAEKNAALDVSSAQVSNDGELPTAPTGLAESGPVATVQATGELPAVPQTPANTVSAELITVETDIVIAKINPLGGVIERLELKEEPISLEQKDQGYPLLKSEPDEIFVAQDGLLSKNGAPTHQTQYQSSSQNYDLSGGGDRIVVPLTWVSETGVEFTKTLTFKRNSYVVDIDYAVDNRGPADWVGAQYAQFKRTQPVNTESSFGRLPSYTGAVVYTAEENKYEKVSFDDLEDLQSTVIDGERGLNKQTDNAWVAMLQHYFVGAWIPSHGPKKLYSSTSKKALTEYRVGYRDLLLKRVGAGAQGTFSTKIYLGSKEQSRLKLVENYGDDSLSSEQIKELKQKLKTLEQENNLAEIDVIQKRAVTKFSKTVDYGVLTPIADPLFVGLSWLHKLVGNWGWAIILLTIFIKILFYPLSAASYRSMGKMRKLQPRMQTLKERYKDDRQKFQMEMMALYKKEKVNPAGGCLPMLIQIPVFIALYWVLLESVEMRHAPFALWWQDLSAKDPYYVLPVLMGVSMFFMQKLNPAPMDDIQKKVFMIMPFALTFLFMTFPQGLVLYWVVNNVLTMAQQWFNYRQQEKT